MAEEEENQEGGGGEEVKKPLRIAGLSLPLLILALLNILIMLGGMGAVVYFRLLYQPPVITNTQAIKDIEKVEKKKVVSKEDQADLIDRVAVPLPNLIINLRTQQGGKNRYASVNIVLECSNQACSDEINNLKPKLLDSIRMAVAKRSYAELVQSNTKFRMKHEITRLANSLIEGGNVTNTYFSQFIVQ